MTGYSYQSCRLWGMGLFILLFSLYTSSSQAQCDFINDITGINQGTPPVGNAANPALFTQVYVLVDSDGNIYSTNTTADFNAVGAGLYNLYAVNYDNAETGAVTPLLANGQPWASVEAYGNNISNCLDYTAAYGSGCPIVVCEELTICEYSTISNPATSFNATDHTETYCLVCGDNIEAIDAAANFDLSTIAAATSGANCQLFAVNYRTLDGTPLTVGNTWSVFAADVCAGTACADYIGINLNLDPISQVSGNGVSTYADWVDVSDGCGGAQTATNGGASFTTNVNNICVPDYGSGGINARPLDDDILGLQAGILGGFRAPCTGTMDLTQSTIFYTVECDVNGPSILDVQVNNLGPGITTAEAALYGPIDIICPSLTGGSFVDCDDSGPGSNSGRATSPLGLSTNGNPGEHYLVIVNTDGTSTFTIESTITVMNTQLVSFKGNKRGDKNVLTWETEQNQELTYFELERSNDGVEFTETLGTVDAASNSTQIETYSFDDLEPGVGIKYYRLKIFDNNGNHEYSNVVALDRSNEELVRKLQVYPNPTKGSISVEFALQTEQEVTYEIRDVIGQTILTGQIDGFEGNNQFQIELGNIPSASYILTINVDGYRKNKRIIKQ
ncbi:MAG: T9SS type A sorting domain-containing protein [Saprospiraceae bacterium]|nr:T9SS type A sorting domain-containing protein [Saprospiraceae bacterium]